MSIIRWTRYRVIDIYIVKRVENGGGLITVYKYHANICINGRR